MVMATRDGERRAKTEWRLRRCNRAACWLGPRTVSRSASRAAAVNRDRAVRCAFADAAVDAMAHVVATQRLLRIAAVSSLVAAAAARPGYLAAPLKLNATTYLTVGGSVDARAAEATGARLRHGARPPLQERART